MPARAKDPTEPIRLAAGRYAGVDEGTACTQSSFKAGKNAFLYIGPQGGRYKAMFKLGTSRAEAERLAKKEPDRFDVGSTSWVTARFSAEEPMPRALWKKWLDESYALSAGASSGTKKTAASKRKQTRKTGTRPTSKKKPAARKTGKPSTRKRSG